MDIKRFSNPIPLRPHRAIEKFCSLECGLCKERFKRSDLYFSHILNFHGLLTNGKIHPMWHMKKQKWFCKYCIVSFRDYNSAIGHIRNVNDPHCGAKYREEYSEYELCSSVRNYCTISDL